MSSRLLLSVSHWLFFSLPETPTSTTCRLRPPQTQREHLSSITMPQSQEPKRVMTPVVIVFLIIVYLYYATVFVVIDNWLGLNSSVGFFNAVLFSGLTAMTVLTYIMAISSDPGTVPLRYRPDLENPDIPLHEIKKVFVFAVIVLFIRFYVLLVCLCSNEECCLVFFFHTRLNDLFENGGFLMLFGCDTILEQSSGVYIGLLLVLLG
ncbi:putative protein S-acyltransferase [Dioscorea sansibarensis]